MISNPRTTMQTCAWLLFACATVGCHAGDIDTAAAVRVTPDVLSSGEYESSPTFSQDGTEVYFFRADRGFGRYRLLTSRCVDGRWTEPVSPSFARPGVSEADPSLSADGRWLYYVSARADPAGERLDIWRVQRNAGGAWGEPERLPEPVNSAESQLLPRPQPDGRLLFGSSRPGGMGQGDIYLATPETDGRWRVENFGPPISSDANEYEAELSRDGNVLVTVANRGTTSHLYVYERDGTTWRERGRVPARTDVFQVGPLLSPDGRRLLFSQADTSERSGEWFLIDLEKTADSHWPPRCGG
ncbi:TolB family protein [Lysobacter panacisoli]|uniref:WD40-like Beta Propeller Repeat n=1 Tax=Lysobacter panacisoli TaxID=1255263 RepID=A0ABP9L3G5_9GAMM|nr:PD40 domain-containing protein [Lysobacter panacisoli]